MVISPAMRAAIRRSDYQQYRLARAVGMHPSTLSAWMCGIYDPRSDDERVYRLGQLLGIPPDQVLVETTMGDPEVELRGRW